ncbi:hypothetical protein PC116_g25048 [Phytophthora cactorum]|uniref:Uncharacterized protein n=1 Tax=Phytophthora cactorum TaxID=29920 RepID=A0A8T1B9D4_9STRA|nr:hypothetical protein PC114_g23184 [Phytophthora cactorum]KAG2896885.1 hypothetical protein PC117_g22896 [Phytophthora cactorum]KAG3130636.1 hypothetical protein C6341_g23668 [Phytophthora cactorum]KAG4226547.1 hypothetical protein PC116_g25048 [Phytophthora cactorum]
MCFLFYVEMLVQRQEKLVSPLLHSHFLIADQLEHEKALLQRC